MFLKSSRYALVGNDSVMAPDGRTVTIVRLRRLPATSGTSTVVREHNQLDLIAQRRFTSATLFWHIADANSELQARDLLAEVGKEINIPES
jgi:hypothetical protein